MTFSPSPASHAEHRLLSARLPHLLRIGLLARQLQGAEPWLPEPLLLALQTLHRSCTGQKRADPHPGMLGLARSLLLRASAHHEDIKAHVAELEREISAVRASFASLDGVIAQARVELEREAACLMIQLRAPALRSAAAVADADDSCAPVLPSGSARGEPAGAPGPAHLSTSLVTIAAQSRILAKAITAIGKARAEFVGELEHVARLAHRPWQQASDSSSLVALLLVRRAGEPTRIQAIAARVFELQRGSLLHAAREAAFRELCVRTQTAVENHIRSLRLP